MRFGRLDEREGAIDLWFYFPLIEQWPDLAGEGGGDRALLLDAPGASYGGSWTYELAPGPSPATTNLRITETGFIKPAVFRFVMAHVMGPTHNLDEYMKDIQTAATKS